MIVIDGQGLTPQAISRLSDPQTAFALGADVLKRVASTARYGDELARERPIYGRTTGVGANRGLPVHDPAGHARALLTSHATGAGPLRARDRVRAMLAVRLNQLAAGGSGVSPEIVTSLVALLRADTLPPVRELGSLGTGDLPALAVTALCLGGQLPTSPPYAGPIVQFGASDALPFLSSNAAALGDAALAAVRLGRLALAAVGTAALTLAAVDGNLEAYSPLAEAATPLAGSVRICRLMRALVTPASAPARIQDPFGLRVLPQVQGALLQHLTSLEQVVTTMVNVASENPVLRPQHGAAHHGGFYAAYLAQVLDTVVIAATHSAQLSLARTIMFNEPQLTGLSPFLATGEAGASGVMIVEYVAASAVASLRTLAHPATLQTVTLSRGTEEDASYASIAARQALEAVEAYRTVLACELLAAVRCLRMRGLEPPGLASLLAACDGLNRETADRDLTDDVSAAEAALDRVADLTEDALTGGG